ncbi:phospho-sugar mutase [Neisseria leonii]|uniref:phospho-sugar mutase n=1 Tax=Neisseria leonii TaxID=2995413 RepID=UPI00237B6F4F|nr:phospho-sugar mutase [Neisseria sp. 3986]MDD9325031.1 phospho-sugar mutase [Neisseria sp. 3986]
MILEQAKQWVAQDPDPETQSELSALIRSAEQGNEAAQHALAKAFDGRLKFGTAGLRGPLQAGPMGMNRVLVIQTASGLAEFLKQHDSSPSIVIGYDGRKNSDIFARDTAEIMAAAGIETFLLPHQTPTPVLAYAVKHLDTAAGVMVTASHNPPQDNGYKVYLGKAEGGGQIVSPADRQIAAAIDRAAQGDIRRLPRSPHYQTVSPDVIDTYIRKTAAVRTSPPRPVNYVYTAMHGVGKDILLHTLSAAGLPLPHLVEAQAEPDAAFPTVAFPNPEEPGALDLAVALAKEKNAELIIANDPDADRLAVAVPDTQGNWQTLHGNVIGCYLAWHMAGRAQAEGRRGTLACSLVSSPALGKIAEHFRFGHQETLTGFKYIGKVDNLIYGFEEALGYLVDPEKVRDKDGISAAVAFLDLVCALKAEGRTLADYAADFERTFGAYASGQISIRVDDPQDIPKLMAALRSHMPQRIGSQSITAATDYMDHDEPNDILVFRLEDGSRLIVRPSGTEPKVKFYLDVRGDNAAHATQTLAEFDAAVRGLLRSGVYGKLNC